MKIYVITNRYDKALTGKAFFTESEAIKHCEEFDKIFTEIEVEGEATIWMVMDTAITNIYFISFDEREARAFHKVNGFIFSEVIEWPVPYRHYDHERYRLPTQEEIDAIDLDAKDEEE